MERISGKAAPIGAKLLPDEGAALALVWRRKVFQHVQGMGYDGKKHLQALFYSLGAAG